MKALIVDDDRVLADVLAFTLRREGFQIVLAHDGEAALQRFARSRPTWWCWMSTCRGWMVSWSAKRIRR